MVGYRWAILAQVWPGWVRKKPYTQQAEEPRYNDTEMFVSRWVVRFIHQAKGKGQHLLQPSTIHTSITEYIPEYITLRSTVVVEGYAVAYLSEQAHTRQPGH